MHREHLNDSDKSQKLIRLLEIPLDEEEPPLKHPVKYRMVTSNSSLNNTSMLSGQFAFGMKVNGFTNETAQTELSEISGTLLGMKQLT